VAVSPSSRRSAARTVVLSGTTYRPSLGQSAVVHRVAPICAVTGIMPQPYVTAAATASMAAHWGSGTVMKWNGDGPRQNQISPVNSRFMRSE